VLPDTKHAFVDGFHFARCPLTPKAYTFHVIAACPTQLVGKGCSVSHRASVDRHGVLGWRSNRLSERMDVVSVHDDRVADGPFAEDFINIDACSAVSFSPFRSNAEFSCCDLIAAIVSTTPRRVVHIGADVPTRTGSDCNVPPTLMIASRASTGVFC